MPGGDRTGPAGMGPMTGRAAGYCAGYPVPGYVQFGGGRGGWGRGRGHRHRFYAAGLTGRQRRAWGAVPYGVVPQAAPVVPPPPTREQEMEMLRQQAEHLAGVLEEMKQRIEQLQPKEQGQ